MEKEKSPSDKLKEISTASRVLALFFVESGDPEQARKQMWPFMVWLRDKAIEALSAEIEESGELSDFFYYA